MQDLNKIYRLWLKAKHLPPGGTTATIKKITVEDLHPRPGVTERKAVLWFKNANRQLILNQGNYGRLVEVAGEDSAKWVGVEVRLTPGKWGSKDTVILGEAK